MSSVDGIATIDWSCCCDITERNPRKWKPQRKSNFDNISTRIKQALHMAITVWKKNCTQQLYKL